MKQKTWLFTGVGILLVLGMSYFVKIPVETGVGYEVYSPLLGLLILYQPIILGLYIIAGGYCIWRGIRGKITFV